MLYSSECYVTINVDKRYLSSCSKQLTKEYNGVELFYKQLIKTGLIKIINKGWVFDPEEYDFLFKIKPDGVNGFEFLVLTKATMVDLLKKRRVIQYIIVNKLTNEN